MRLNRRSSWLSQARGCGFVPSIWRQLNVFPVRGRSAAEGLRKGTPAFRLRTREGHCLTNPGSASQSTWIGWQHAWIMCLLPFALLASLSIAQNGQKPRQDFAALSREADAARDAEDLSKAAPLYQRALALRPAWKEGWWSLGMVQYVKSDFANCARAFRKLISLTPTNGTAYAMLGLCQFELGRDEQALHNIERGGALGVPSDNQLRDVMRYHQGILLQRLGRFEGARESFEGLCADHVETKEVLIRLGMVFLEMSDRTPPVREPSADVILGVGQAACLAAQDKRAQARQAYIALIHQYPDFPHIHYAYGRFLVDKANEPDAAAKEFEQEISNNPGDAVAWLQVASAKYRIDSSGGLPYAEEAVRLNPQYPFGHYVLGLLLVDTGEYQKAIPELETARRTFPYQIPQLYFSLGVAYSHVGRKEEAAHARAMFEQLKKKQEQQTASPEPSGDTGNGNIRPPQ